MQVHIRLVTFDRDLIPGKFPHSSDSKGARKVLSDDLALEVRRSARHLSPGQPEIIDLVASFGSRAVEAGAAVGVGLLTAFLYDWLKGSRATLRINESAKIDIDKDSISIALTRAIELPPSRRSD